MINGIAPAESHSGNQASKPCDGSDRREGIVIQQSPDALDQTQFALSGTPPCPCSTATPRRSGGCRRRSRRIEDGSCGICLCCEDPIRPQAVPWELCLGCQERSDLRAARVPDAGGDDGVALGIG